jgi:MoxR-like ATPase
MIDSLKTTIQTVGERYFVDRDDKLMLLAISYLMGRNVLVIGEPGFGKTSAAKTILSVLSGLPYDLYEACQIEGHPEQTRETLVGRPDFHKLMTEGEVTLWNLAVFLPGLLVDEVNRLPEGKQDVLLTCVDTGRFNSPLGHSVFTGKRPFIATANHADDGSLMLTPAMLDRFDITIEFGYPGPFYREAIGEATRRRSEIRSVDLTNRLVARLQDRDITDDARLQAVTEVQAVFGETLAEHGLTAITESALQDWQEQLNGVGISSEALLLLDCLESEMNFSPLYGLKRRSDPIDTSTHSKALAHTRVYNAFSPRAGLAVQQYARALALLDGRAEADKADLLRVVPHVLGHRLQPTEDFRAEFADRRRGTGGSETFELSSQLLLGVEANFAEVYESLKLLDGYRRGTLDDSGRARAEALLRSDLDRVDHPLLRQFIAMINDA